MTLALGLALATAAAPAFAVDLREPQSHLGFVVPDGWTLAEDGAWSQVDAPDHRFRGRITAHARGVLPDSEAETTMLNLLSQKWATYTVDQHARRMTWPGFAGVEILGHGSGDSWDRAKFHMLLVVDRASPQRGVIVWLSGREDAWETYHGLLDRAVRLLHA